jgi:methionyl-tRNA formyltransferase
MKIVFFGTPDFATATLSAIVLANYDVVGVVTAPDRKAGRGRKISESSVKEFANKQSLKLLQPTNLKNEEFISELIALKADVFVVVAFRMLPEVVWAMPPKGTFNIHASLLPQYRGAAPINWAIINGEKKTGVSTFFLQHQIDTGEIIGQVETLINENDNVEDLHKRLMLEGAKLAVKTLSDIENGEVKSTPQPTDIYIQHAPKIFKETCQINWSQEANKVHDFIRGLSPYPGAYTFLKTKQLKVFKTSKTTETTKLDPGAFTTDGKTSIAVATASGLLKLEEIQLEGKKRMNTEEFLRGYSNLFD